MRIDQIIFKLSGQSFANRFDELGTQLVELKSKETLSTAEPKSGSKSPPLPRLFDKIMSTITPLAEGGTEFLRKSFHRPSVSNNSSRPGSASQSPQTPSSQIQVPATGIEQLSVRLSSIATTDPALMIISPSTPMSPHRSMPLQTETIHNALSETQLKIDSILEIAALSPQNLSEKPIAASPTEMITPSVEAPEDSPLFRATLIDYEKRTAILKQQMKKLSKSAENVLTALQHLNETESQFAEAIRNISALQDSLGYLCQARDIIQQSREHYMRQFETLVLAPLKMFYINDVKSAEMHKKEFDSASDEFYHYANKYLSNKAAPGSGEEKRMAKAREKDAKYNRKRTTFDFYRYNYYAFLQELHGRKSAELKNYFLLMAEKERRWFDETARKLLTIRPQLDNLDRIMKSDGSRASIEVREREEMKKQLRSVVERAETEEKQAKEMASSSEGRRSRSESSQFQSFPVNNSKFRGIRDLDPNSVTSFDPVESKREGIPTFKY